ncbi:sugar O-acetyltransferase [Bombilactobacillus folatiphilus]|uniref:Acetyltransferase n=1 Tax=Bombilactobacillus folatiphilus TaxID=2923362 RepID=A0ABY4PCD6_9LACO|nr:sugar O-acetyltransferase [Bombilactobacillus folatiphilus]UQS82932.1 sugar O-acetyltransferase [Bombilactobacillus folatiphilus]
MQSEKDKFLAGQPYQIMDPQLAHDETRARRLCRELNELDDQATIQKEQVIEQLFGSVGKNPYIQPNFRCDFGYNIHVGDNFLCNYDCTILDIATVTIGNNCLMAPKVQLYAADHPQNVVQRSALIGLGRPITIGNNVWIGGSSVILPGVSLGDNVIVGANSTVTKSFGDNVVIAGSPAKIIKQLPKQG